MPTPQPQLLVIGFGPLLEGHHRHDRLAPLGVGHADHRRLQHSGVSVQHVLDLGGSYVQPAPDDEVLHPVDDVDVSLLIDLGHVPTVHPPVPQRLSSALGVPEIALHHVGAAENNLAPLSDGDILAVGVHHPHVHRIRRLAARRQQLRPLLQSPHMVLFAQDGADGGDLGHAVELVEHRAEALHQLGQAVGGDGRRAVAQGAQRPQLVVVGPL